MEGQEKAGSHAGGLDPACSLPGRRVVRRLNELADAGDGQPLPRRRGSVRVSQSAASDGGDPQELTGLTGNGFDGSGECLEVAAAGVRHERQPARP